MTAIDILKSENEKLRARLIELETKQENLLLMKKIQELEEKISDESDLHSKSRNKRRTKNAYMFFLQDKRQHIIEKIRKEKGIDQVFPQQVCSVAGPLWRSLSEEERRPYVIKAKELKESVRQQCVS